jgi:hypothetical protein
VPDKKDNIMEKYRSRSVYGNLVGGTPFRTATVLAVSAFMLASCKPENCPAPAPGMGGRAHPYWVHRGVTIIQDMVAELPAGGNVSGAALTCPLAGADAAAATDASNLLSLETLGDTIDPNACAANADTKITDKTNGVAYLFTSKGGRLVYFMLGDPADSSSGAVDYWPK